MDYLAIGEKGMTYMVVDYRRAADLFLKATKKAPTKNAKMRYYYYYLYTMILRELHFDATKSELKFLREKFLDNKGEPPHFRVSASFCLGVVLSTQGGRGLAGDAYREGLLVAQQMEKEEGHIMVYSDDGEFPASYFIGSHCRTIRNNLSILMGRGRLPGYRGAEKVRNDGTSMPIVGNFEKVSITPNNVCELSRNRVVERAEAVGGERCDHCAKSAQSLGLQRLQTCSRCQFMYYCSKECQTSAWMAGHKQACRKKNQIKTGDYMKLVRLVRNDGLNGELVRVLERQEGTDRTAVGSEEQQKSRQVEILSTGATMLVLTSNLKHIRPAR